MMSAPCCAVAAVLLLATMTAAASIDTTNLVFETPRLASGEQLVSAVINDCFAADTMSCLKGKVLNYLDTQLGVNEEYGRSFEGNKIDEVIYDRAARVLAQQSVRVQLPETVFDKAVLSYTPETGLDISPAAEEGRGHLLKKKVLLPILLLLKLKFKALLPIFVALIGLKALKALILSKLAISLVLGFVVYQLIAKKSAAMPMPMSMTESPMTAYGPPTSSSASSSYDSSAWDTSSSGGPYARVWEPSTSSSGQNLAYSSYYPSSSSSSGSSSGSSASLTSSSSSGSATSGSSY